MIIVDQIIILIISGGHDLNTVYNERENEVLSETTSTPPYKEMTA